MDHHPRTKETNEKYKEYLKHTRSVDFLTKNRVATYTHWIIIKDEFPYDAIATTHDLLIPKRIFAERKDMNTQEAEELEHLVQHTLPKTYEILLDKLSKKARSILDHYHIHLLNLKKH